MKTGKVLGILIGFIIYVGVAIWGIGQGDSVGSALLWPFGVLLLGLFGWASGGRRR